MLPFQLLGQTEAVLFPQASDARVYKQQAKPCIAILVHGVNDLGGVYDDIETGICTGLNERLDHLLNQQGTRSVAALNPASYSSPQDDAGRAPNPDAVYYRRIADQSKDGGPVRSVVIPFYWGYREEEAQIIKDTDHGEWLDRYFNRLDKDGTKGGGVFANATTSLPDMFGQGFSGKVAGLSANANFGTPDHPLLPAPSRRYMVLAAQRLAMLVRIIRRYRHADGRSGQDDTINVVGHSQGNLIALLANALLHEQGQRPIDGLTMMSPPYSLQESFLEHSELDNAQQTSQARLQTLSNIVRHIGSHVHARPSFQDMADPSKHSCVGGLRWTGGQCETTIDGKTVRFDERDNRGTVHLYFSPQDQTVGMANVQGIGWQGVADTLDIQRDAAPRPSRREPEGPPRRITDTLPALPELGARFYQRIFTMRERNGQGEAVGRLPRFAYPLLAKGESTWEGTSLDWKRTMVANTDFSTGQTVTIQAPVLPVPFVPDFVGTGRTLPQRAVRGIQPVWNPVDPIDASIAITNGGIAETLPARVMELPGGQRGKHPPAKGPALYRALEEQATDLNSPERNPYHDRFNNEWAADWHRAAHVQPLGGTRYEVRFAETPNQARRRIMDAEATRNEALSFHSAIPACAMHSRRALAFDLAIGQACSIDDEVFYEYLCRVADWRLDWEVQDQSWKDSQTTPPDQPSDEVLAHYKAEAPEDRQLIDDTCLYRSSQPIAAGTAPRGGGVLPAATTAARLPGLVVSQTIGRRWQTLQPSLRDAPLHRSQP